MLTAVSGQVGAEAPSPHSDMFQISCLKYPQVVLVACGLQMLMRITDRVLWNNRLVLNQSGNRISITNGRRW